MHSNCYDLITTTLNNKDPLSSSTVTKLVRIAFNEHKRNMLAYRLYSNPLRSIPEYNDDNEYHSKARQYSMASTIPSSSSSESITRIPLTKSKRSNTKTLSSSSSSTLSSSSSSSTLSSSYGPLHGPITLSEDVVISAAIEAITNTRCHAYY